MLTQLSRRLAAAQSTSDVFNIHYQASRRLQDTIPDPDTTCVCHQIPLYSAPITSLSAASSIVWQIELHNGVDNRLVKALVNDAFKPALQIVEREWRKEREEGNGKKDKDAGTAALVIVGRLDQEKFFSNGAPDLS
jgi:hypothetical protein